MRTSTEPIKIAHLTKPLANSGGSVILMVLVILSVMATALFFVLQQSLSVNLSAERAQARASFQILAEELRSALQNSNSCMTALTQMDPSDPNAQPKYKVKFTGNNEAKVSLYSLTGEFLVPNPNPNPKIITSSRFGRVDVTDLHLTKLNNTADPSVWLARLDITGMAVSTSGSTTDSSSPSGRLLASSTDETKVITMPLIYLAVRLKANEVVGCTSNVFTDPSGQSIQTIPSCDQTKPGHVLFSDGNTISCIQTLCATSSSNGGSGPSGPTNNTGNNGNAYGNTPPVYSKPTSYGADGNAICPP
jgi:type II secretory pathway pseudopilin PulG